MLTLHPYDYNGLELYHISPVNHDGEIFYPRVPESRMKTEDDKTPRICFAPTLEGAYKAVCPNPRHLDLDLFFLHVPDNMDDIKAFNSIVSPDENEVPDVLDTDELWCLDPVYMKCIGVIMFFTVDRFDNTYDHKDTKAIDVTDIMEDYHGAFERGDSLYTPEDEYNEGFPDDLMDKLRDRAFRAMKYNTGNE